MHHREVGVGTVYGVLYVSDVDHFDECPVHIMGGDALTHTCIYIPVLRATLYSMQFPPHSHGKI